MSHFAFTTLMAVLVSGASSLVDPGTAGERAFRAARTFLGCAAAIVAGGWFMHLVHG